jgi:hypothetical protein
MKRDAENTTLVEEVMQCHYTAGHRQERFGTDVAFVIQDHDGPGLLYDCGPARSIRERYHG